MENPLTQALDLDQGNPFLSPTRYFSGPTHKNPLRLSVSPTTYHNLSDLRTRSSYLSMQLDSSYGACCPDTMRRSDQPHPNICAHCPELDPPVDQCAEAACPILDLTSQCTDQCVVVACDDPTHPEPSCHLAGSDAVCDSACMLDKDCVDCPGLDELLRCCTDYHSYSSQSKSLDVSQSIWDPSSVGYRDHQHPSQILSEHSDICTVTCPPSAIFPDTPSSTSSGFSSPALSQGAPQFPPLSLQQHLSQPSTHMFNCRWANCKAVYSSFADLVEHVNGDHFRFPNHPIHQAFYSDVPNHQFDLNALSCQWGNCAMYPFPGSIPSSSMSAFPDSALDVLTTHLMQDHLGVHYPFPQATTVRTALSLPTPTASTGHMTPSPPLSLPDVCNGTPKLSRTHSVASPQGSSSHLRNHSPTDCSNQPCKWMECTETFSSSDDLTAHILSAHIGSGKAHYECYWEGCSRHGKQGFSSKQKVARHMQSHTGHRPFQCQTCGQYFSETATLQQHMRRHTREKPYVCDFPGCGKAFAITGALTIHKRTHNGIKPFKCTYCEKTFTESSNLSKHLRTHTGARPYSCPEDGCGKSFARPDQLGRHMRIHRKKGVEQEVK